MDLHPVQIHAICTVEIGRAVFLPVSRDRAVAARQQATVDRDVYVERAADDHLVELERESAWSARPADLLENAAALAGSDRGDHPDVGDHRGLICTAGGLVDGSRQGSDSTTKEW